MHTVSKLALSTGMWFVGFDDCRRSVSNIIGPGGLPRQG
jgi:hypothetical protein